MPVKHVKSAGQQFSGNAVKKALDDIVSIPVTTPFPTSTPRITDVAFDSLRKSPYVL